MSTPQEGTRRAARARERAEERARQAAGQSFFGSWPGPAPDARGRGTAAPDERSLLFVCTGNVARSAAAELLARERAAGLGLTVASAGVAALVGSGTARDVRGAIAARGVSPAGHSGRQISRADVESAGLVLCLDHDHLAWILDEWPNARGRTALLREAAEIARRIPAAQAREMALAIGARERGDVRADSRPAGPRHAKGVPVPSLGGAQGDGLGDPAAPSSSGRAGRRGRRGVRSREAPVARWLVAQCTDDPAWGVPDPFRRGAEQGEAAVAAIAAALDALLPWYADALGPVAGEGER